jgi:hypothetical protein
MVRPRQDQPKEGYEWNALFPACHLSYALTEPLGHLVIVHAEDLQHTRVGDKSIGPRALEVFQLAHVLKDGPELQAIARHQPHGAFHRFQTAKGCKFIKEDRGGLFHVPRACLSGFCVSLAMS